MPRQGDDKQLSAAANGTGSGDDQERLMAQIREIYGRVAYTHKTHEKQADMCADLNRRQRFIKVVLTAISSGAFLASISGLLLNQQWAALVTSFIAVLVSAASLGDKAFRHGEEMQEHRDTAAKLWGLRESYLSLIVDLGSQSITGTAGRAERDRLQHQVEAIVSDAPRTTSKAYARAQDALQHREDLTFSESEIDQLLPAQLRDERGVDGVAG
jgi:hypothetical protein